MVHLFGGYPCFSVSQSWLAFGIDPELVLRMATSKKPKKASKVPPTYRTILIISPRPVEEEEESKESDFDPPSPNAY